MDQPRRAAGQIREHSWISLSDAAVTTTKATSLLMLRRWTSAGFFKDNGITIAVSVDQLAPRTGSDLGANSLLMPG